MCAQTRSKLNARPSVSRPPEVCGEMYNSQLERKSQRLEYKMVEAQTICSRTFSET